MARSEFTWQAATRARTANKLRTVLRRIGFRIVCWQSDNLLQARRQDRNCGTTVTLLFRTPSWISRANHFPIRKIAKFRASMFADDHKHLEVNPNLSDELLWTQ